MDAVVLKLKSGQFQGLEALIGDILEASSAQRKMDAASKFDFCYFMLKQASTYLSGLQDKDVSKDEVEEVAKIVHTACKYCSETLTSDTASSMKRIKVLYHILCSFIRWQFVAHAMRLSVFILDEAEDLLTKVNNTVEIINIMKNSYLLLWNHALQFENEKNTIHKRQCIAFQCRVKALEFLSYCCPNTDKLIDQACRAVQVLEPEDGNELLTHYEEAHKLVLKVVLRSAQGNDMLDSLTKLQKWNGLYAAFLEKSGHASVCLELYTNLEKLMLPTIVNTTSKFAAEKCFKLIKMWYQTPFSFTEIPELCQSLEKLCSESTQNVLQFVLSVLKCIEEIVLSKKDANPGACFLLPKDVLSVAVMFEIHANLLALERQSDKLDVAILTINYTTSAVVLLQWMRLLTDVVRDANNNVFIRNVVKRAHTALNLLTEFMMEDAFDGSMLNLHCFHNLGVTTGNLGIYCYNRSWYEESMPFMDGACTFLTKWCLEDESSKQERMQKINLWNKYLLLATDYRKIGCYEKALDALSKALVLFGEPQPDFFDCWVRIKRDAALNASCNLKERTLRCQLLKTSVNHKLDVYSLLQMELNAYKQTNYYTGDEIHAVITAMFKEAQNDVQKAAFWIELAQVQWIKPFKHEQSSVDCCKTAIFILKKVLKVGKKKEPINGELHCQLARAWFWLYLSKLQETQDSSLVTVTKAQVTPLEQKLEVPKGEEVNENDVCDVIPAHKHITVDAELKALEALDESLEMWKQIVETDCALITDGPQAVQDLKSAAEIYALSGEVVKEMQAWRLAFQLSKYCGIATEVVTCAACLGQLLCHTENLEEAEGILVECKDFVSTLGESSVDLYANIKYSVTAAEVYLLLRKVELGAKYLYDAWCHPYLKKKSKMSYLLIADVNVVASMFLLVPQGVYDSPGLQPWSDSNAIGLVVAALQHLMMIAKVLCSFNEQMYERRFSHHIVNSITNVNMILGRMYIDIGVPREARCYLKEQLAMCQRMALAVRSAEVLLLLSEVDLISDNTMDCQVKLNGIEYILEPSTKNKQQTKLSTPLERNLFSTSYMTVAVPDYLNHPSECHCPKCRNSFMANLALNMLQLQSDCLALEGILLEAVQLSSYIKDVYHSRVTRKSKEQAKCSLIFDALKFPKALLQLSTLLSSQEKYENALETLDEGIQKLKTLAYHYVDLFSLLAKFMWQKYVCIIHIMSKHCNMAPLEWLSKQLWKDSKLQSSTELFMDDLTDVLGRKSLTTNVPFSPLMPCWNTLSTSGVRSQSVTSEFGDYGTPMVKLEDKRALLASKLATCKAPVKKWHASKLIGNPNWCVEPDEVFAEVENIPTNSRRTRLRNRTLMQDSDESVTKSHLTQTSGVSAALFKNSSEKKLLPQSKGLNKIPSNVFGLPGCWNSEKLSESDTDTTEKDAALTEEELARTAVKSKRTSRRNCRTRTGISVPASGGESLRGHEDDASPSPLGLSMPSPPVNDVDLLPLSPTAILMGPPMELPRGGRREKNAAGTKRPRSTRCSASVDDEVEVLRKAEVNAVATSHDLSQKVTQDNDEAFLTNRYTNGLSAQSLVLMLEEAYGYVVHHPLCPLYSDLCIALALLKGMLHLEAGFFVSESAASTLRHRTVHNLERKTWISKPACEDKLTDPEPKKKASDYLDIMKLHMNAELTKDSILKKHIDSIPEGWVVCQITAVPSAIARVDKHHNRNLVLARYEKGKKPILMQVPSMQENHMVHKNMLDAFNKILEGSKDTMAQLDKSKWWEARRALDADLKVLLADVENFWLGCWKALVLGNVVKSDAKIALNSIAVEAVKACSSIPYNAELLEVIVNALPWLSSTQISEGVAYLLGLDIKSSRVLSLSRLLSKATKDLPCDIERLPVILILGKEVEFLPWESIPILRSHAVSRMPSLSLLHGHVTVLQSQPDSAYHSKVDTKNTFFVLNPGNDLPYTQQSFEELFTKKLNWNGIVKRAPSEEEISTALSDYDLFVYCGHGSGTKYLSGDRIQRLCCRAVSLLMGCSSGKLHGFGKHLEPAGVVLQYLLAGCPCVLGCLWDVTDRDIDKFLQHLLRSWISSSDLEMVLPLAVANARAACRLTYLIGCSPVVYGLPITAQAGANSLE